MSVQSLSRRRAAGTEAPSAGVQACGPFVLDTPRHRLTRDGRPASLTPKGFVPLRVCGGLLARGHGRVLLRQDLVFALRSETSVEDGNLWVQTSTRHKTTGQRSSDGG